MLGGIITLANIGWGCLMMGAIIGLSIAYLKYYMDRILNLSPEELTEKIKKSNARTAYLMEITKNWRWRRRWNVGTMCHEHYFGPP